jgi:7-carboxy-7-deazaguanine synthase
MSLDDILNKVQEHRALHCVVTGGEPMIAKEVKRLCERLKKLGKHITIETAGTVDPGNITCDLASLSPKLSNSTPSKEGTDSWYERHEKTRLQPEVLREWVNRYEYQFKFVVTSVNDLEEIKTLLRDIEHPVPSEKVMLMAEGVDCQTIRGRDQTLIDICKQEGYRYCNRLQIELFGDARGT